ncbi:alpha/beta fold hydrolase [Kitasatospora sp. NPDC093558]|uniref:thioesterase II family protein n=1 Tax=Kitasatospora sp. NPDC093558 TaxID=3155201 RepID=UPI0034461F5E
MVLPVEAERGRALTAHWGPWLRRYHGPPVRPGATLVCFPHAGGAASFFRGHSEALSGRFDVLAVQYPGRQDRYGERCPETVAELADGIAGAVTEAVTGGGPLAFFGHSLGAVLAFETALRLESHRSGPAPSLLFASARRAPGLHRADRSPDGTGPRELHRLDDHELAQELRRLGGTDERLLADPRLFAKVAPAIRADFAASETYRAEDDSRLRCRIVAMVGDRDPRVGLEQAAAWRDHTTGAFDLRVFPGGHFYLTEHEREVLSTLSVQLDRADEAA